MTFSATHNWGLAHESPSISKVFGITAACSLLWLQEPGGPGGAAASFNSPPMNHFCCLARRRHPPASPCTAQHGANFSPDCRQRLSLLQVLERLFFVNRLTCPLSMSGASRRRNLRRCEPCVPVSRRAQKKGCPKRLATYTREHQFLPRLHAVCCIYRPWSPALSRRALKDHVALCRFSRNHRAFGNTVAHQVSPRAGRIGKLFSQFCP